MNVQAQTYRDLFVAHYMYKYIS